MSNISDTWISVYNFNRSLGLTEITQNGKWRGMKSSGMSDIDLEGKILWESACPLILFDYS